MQNRDGKQISAQVSKMGAITFQDGKNFVLDRHPIQLKNEHGTPVVLEVLPYGNYDREKPDEGWVTTTFSTGWNPEMLIAVRITSQDVDLKWGY